MLTRQGWVPGTYLGAQGSAHASLHTAANMSHIRVAMKDDTLGLGAKRTGAGAGDEMATTGLEGLQSLLGRLNGKSEEVLELEGKKRDEVRRGEVLGKRFGAGLERFVSAGWLVGDVVRERKEEEEDVSGGVVVDGEGEGRKKEGKKRKRAGEGRGKKGKLERGAKDEGVMLMMEEEILGEKKKISTKERMAKQASVNGSISAKEGVPLEPKTKTKPKTKPKTQKKSSKKNDKETEEHLEPTSGVMKKDKKVKQLKKQHQQQQGTTTTEDLIPSEPATPVRVHPHSPVRRALYLDPDQDSDSDPDSDAPNSSSPPRGAQTRPAAAEDDDILPPLISPPVTPSTADGIAILEGRRNMLRRRQIRQNRLAVRDERALKEIFMIRA
ncbi:MAG: telomerase inhibitor [Peltula sp. TS41687]|nr:MAG: telomerase inhibitor [Peltula sp. TS41687]